MRFFNSGSRLNTADERRHSRLSIAGYPATMCPGSSELVTPDCPTATAPRTDQFVLNVAASPAAVGSPTGTSGAAAGTVTAGRYSLTGNSGMSQYVGKRVEVTGTKVERGSNANAGAGGAVGTGGATATVPTGASVATEAHPSALTEVRVISVRVLDESCR